MQMRYEVLSWQEVDQIIEHLIPQFEVAFEGMVIVTRGGMIPGGMLAEALDLKHILTAAVDFPAEIEKDKSRLYAWPQFIQFPEDEVVAGRRLLIVDDVWGSGRTITAVGNRIDAAGGIPYTCVLHFNPYRNLFGNVKPDYYGVVTDAYIVYPWEIDRGPDKMLSSPLGAG